MYVGLTLALTVSGMQMNVAFALLLMKPSEINVIMEVGGHLVFILLLSHPFHA